MKTLEKVLRRIIKQRLHWMHQQQETAPLRQLTKKVAVQTAAL
jgi:hypothetical protein